MLHPAICHCSQAHLSMNQGVRICPMKETNQLRLFNQKFSHWEYSLCRLSLTKADLQLWQMTRASRENDAPRYFHVCSPIKWQSCDHQPIEKVDGSIRLMQNQGKTNRVGKGHLWRHVHQLCYLGSDHLHQQPLISCFLVDTRSG